MGYGGLIFNHDGLFWTKIPRLQNFCDESLKEGRASRVFSQTLTKVLKKDLFQVTKKQKSHLKLMMFKVNRAFNNIKNHHKNTIKIYKKQVLRGELNGILYQMFFGSIWFISIMRNGSKTRFEQIASPRTHFWKDAEMKKFCLRSDVIARRASI